MDIIFKQKDTGIVLKIYDTQKASKEELVDFLEGATKRIKKGLTNKPIEVIGFSSLNPQLERTGHNL